MKKKTLVILAAGMGSRFGGMKQVEPVGPNGEFIMDYSIFSAIKYGFEKIVFVIKEENYELFKSSVGSRIEKYVKTEYAFQRLEDIPEGFSVPEGRKKPWGTAHAIYAARDYIDDKFAVITADDFYGDDAFKQVADYLDNKDNSVIIGYEIGSTLSSNGSVKRGVIINDSGIVKEIIESSCIKDGKQVKCTPLDETKKEFYVPLSQPVSMLLNGFNKSFLNVIGDSMENEFKNHQDNLLDYEMLTPDIMDEEIKRGKKIEVIPTTSTWMGMTYKEDCEKLKEFILKEIEKEVYPSKLWK